MALHIKVMANGVGEVTQEVSIPDSDRLEFYQKAVGGYIEAVKVPGQPDHVMLVNEEGRLLNLPPNATASALAKRPIVGDVLVVKVPEEFD